ncbi:hypothetical protein ACIBSW_17280 [Actinoplanes sp. NPDC049668]|uniref:hypothetical protein n=1 Tax=unclassified Actinoplanes TaxID=2626549 RepID=UPI0033A89E51
MAAISQRHWSSESSARWPHRDDRRIAGRPVHSGGCGINSPTTPASTTATGPGRKGIKHDNPPTVRRGSAGLAALTGILVLADGDLAWLRLAAVITTLFTITIGISAIAGALPTFGAAIVVFEAAATLSHRARGGTPHPS